MATFLVFQKSCWESCGFSWCALVEQLGSPFSSVKNMMNAMMILLLVISWSISYMLVVKKKGDWLFPSVTKMERGDNGGQNF